jgi:hypothetical protein
MRPTQWPTLRARADTANADIEAMILGKKLGV